MSTVDVGCAVPQERVEALVERAYEAVEPEVEAFFAARDAGPRTVVREGRVSVYGDGTCHYRSVQPCGEGARVSRQVPLDADWPAYCEEVYAPLAAAAARDSRPGHVEEALAALVDREGPDIEGEALAPVRDWLETRPDDMVVEQVVYEA